MAAIDEIAPDVFSICTYNEQIDLQFRQFLILDKQPLLYHTGPRRTFERVRTPSARSSTRRLCAGSPSAISRPTSAGP